MDFESLLLELSREGFECAQILMLSALSLEGEENPGLIRAMSGLCSGMGRTGGACGALTGGCCALGYFTGKGDPEELEHSRAREIIAAYATWFRECFGTENCRDIVGGDYSKCLTVCAPMMEECYGKLLELMDEYNLLGA